MYWNLIGKGWYRLMDENGEASMPLVSIFAQPKERNAYRAWHAMIKVGETPEEIASGRTAWEVKARVKVALGERGDVRAAALPDVAMRRS